MEIQGKYSEDARAFVNQRHKAHQGSGKWLGGNAKLSERQWESCRAAIAAYVSKSQPQHISEEVAMDLLERFEKLCKRHQTEVPDYLRTGILDSLVEDLLANQLSLNLPLEKLTAVSAYAGAVGPKLPKEFPEFADTPGVYREVATHTAREKNRASASSLPDFY